MSKVQIVLLLVAAYIILQTVYSGYYMMKSSDLVKKTYTGEFTLGNKGKPTYKVWVDGDSVGAGIGASSFETSVVGRISAYLAENSYVELTNNSVSGTKMTDLTTSELSKDKQDLIILIVSSNDLFHFSNVNSFKQSTRKVLDRYSPLADKVIIIGPGRIYDANALPFFVRPVYRMLSSKYVDIISEEAKKHPNVIHIDPSKTSVDRNTYGPTGAEDNFHPNDEGHRFWFDLIKPSLK